MLRVITEETRWAYMSRRHTKRGGRASRERWPGGTAFQADSTEAHTVENEPNTHRLPSPDALPTKCDALLFCRAVRDHGQDSAPVSRRRRATKRRADDNESNARKDALFLRTQTIKLPRPPSYKNITPVLPIPMSRSSLSLSYR